MQVTVEADPVAQPVPPWPRWARHRLGTWVLVTQVVPAGYIGFPVGNTLGPETQYASACLDFDHGFTVTMLMVGSKATVTAVPDRYPCLVKGDATRSVLVLEPPQGVGASDSSTQLVVELKPSGTWQVVGNAVQQLVGLQLQPVTLGLFELLQHLVCRLRGVVAQAACERAHNLLPDRIACPELCRQRRATQQRGLGNGLFVRQRSSGKRL